MFAFCHPQRETDLLSPLSCQPHKLRARKGTVWISGIRSRDGGRLWGSTCSLSSLDFKIHKGSSESLLLMSPRGWADLRRLLCWIQWHYTADGSQCPVLKPQACVGWQMKAVLRMSGRNEMSVWISGHMVIYGFVYYLYKQLVDRVLGFYYQEGDCKLWNSEICTNTKQHQCRSTHTMLWKCRLSWLISLLLHSSLQNSSVLLIAGSLHFFPYTGWLMTIDVTCCLLGGG